ncbi:MAG: histidine--tRNA ligase [Alphaproteobacteria bacterium]
MSSLQPVRGTHDHLPEDARRYRAVVERARAAVALYGYREISTPIFEFSEVFKRTLGDTSDVVTKEMYSFEDRGGDWITLRPEATAAIARAFISGGLAQNLPLKFFTSGPMFRYERPQKGRLRQFHQIDIELLGIAEPEGDVEIIAAAARVLDALGVLKKTVLELNTLGDSESRTAYRTALLGYLEGFKDKLSADSRERLTRNPLRILDSKDQGDREIVAGAPEYSDFLTLAARDFFARVKDGLEALGIDYLLNPRLVRGLDYYCHTAFEFTTTALGAQGTLIGGGRYDGLIEIMGGRPTPGTGWAGGVERLAELAQLVIDAPRAVAIVPIGEEAQLKAPGIAERLRNAGFTVELGFHGNLKKRMKQANRIAAAAALLIGEDELAREAATLRDLDSGEQREVSLDALEIALAPYR